MSATLMLLVALAYAAQVVHAACTIPANAIGPINGQLGACIAGSTVAAGGSCAYSCNDEWTVTFNSAQNIAQAAGVTVTIGSTTGTLKTELTGAGTMEAIVIMAKDVALTKGSDDITIGTSSSIANTDFSTKISARFTSRRNGYARQVNDGYYNGHDKMCMNAESFACLAGDAGCKLSSSSYDADGTPCSYCSKCFLKSTGASCTWQAAQTSDDCTCGVALTSSDGNNVVLTTSDVLCADGNEANCHCPSSKKEFTGDSDNYNKVTCSSSGDLLTDIFHDKWWGISWPTTYRQVQTDVTDNSMNKDAAFKLSARSNEYHVEIIDGGTGYVTGNTIVVKPAHNDVTLTFTDGNGDGIINDGELTASAPPDGYYVGSVESWTTGQMPAPMICAPERCSWDETGAKITGSDDGVSPMDPGDCQSWGYKGLENCKDQSQGNPWSSTDARPGLCGASEDPAKYCSQSPGGDGNTMCEASKCSYGVFTPGAECRNKRTCQNHFDTNNCPAGSNEGTLGSTECAGSSCTIGECCQSTCGTAFFGRSLTCPSGSAPKSSDSPCGVVDASGACQASNVKSVSGVLQIIKGCCEVTCATAMSVLEAAGKCGGNRAAAKSDSTDSCANDECDEATCCPMLCENAGLTCSLPAEVPKDKECSETSSDVGEQCSAAADGGCACVESCRSWGANGGLCSSPKILDTIDNQACTTKGGACSEQICCVDPPACGTDFKGTAITSACTCGSSSCEVGKFCFNPSDVEGILQNEFTCSATAAPARCGRKTDPSSYSSFTCDAGTEKVEDDVASQCAMDNSCTKEKCCGPRTCTDDSVISGTPCKCEKHGQNSECPVGSSCWDSGKYENSGCKTEAAPSKCSTATCPEGKTTKTAYCPNGDCSEANCCEYTLCTDDGVISGNPCTCEKHGRPKTECPVGSSCWDGGTYDNSGCKTAPAPSAKCDTIHSQCPAGKHPASGYCEQGGCTVESCCKNPGCNGDGTTAADQVCQCGWGTDAIKVCAVGNYCWDDGGPKCTPNNRDSYPSQRCSAGFTGWEGNADTCPPKFEKRDLGPGTNRDDGHMGKMMDYTACCRARCSDLYDNCDDVDSSIQLLARMHVYPAHDGSYSQQECCRRSECKQWSNDGGDCPADKSVRGDEDFHMCSEGSCDADDCCQDNHGGDGDDKSDECKAAEAITHKDYKGDEPKGFHTSQCFNVDTNPGDGKFIYKKGSGSCSVCKDALRLQFGSECENKNGNCGHCQGIIDAYKDCPKTQKEICDEAEEIVTKDREKLTTDTRHKGQCYDAEYGTTDPEGKDPSKWIYEKGPGSCSDCYDAVNLYFGKKCGDSSGECKHCAPAIAAYKDCDSTTTDPTAVVVNEYAVSHTIKLEGLTATEFNSDSKIIESFQQSVASTLGVDASKITNIKATARRRQLTSRRLAGSSCSISYEIVVEDEAAMREMSETVVTKMADSTAFTATLSEAMTTNGVTSVKPDSIKADTSMIPENSGKAGASMNTDTDSMNESSSRMLSRSTAVALVVATAAWTTMTACGW